jgi:TolA-binding protein
MDLAALTALYPVVKEILDRAPQVQKWIEKRARKEDPVFLMQLQILQMQSQSLQMQSQSLQMQSQTLQTQSQILQSIGDLRGYILTTAIMGAMLSNPHLTGEQIKEKFIKSVEVSEDILKTIKRITP